MNRSTAPRMLPSDGEAARGLRPALRVLLALAIAVGASAQTTPAREMKIVLGKGELLRFGNDIQRVAVAEPKVADAVVVSPHEVMVNAKGLGKTTLIIWESGSVPARYEIDVVYDASSLESIRRELRDAVGDGTIDATGNPETIVLTGSVKDPEQAKRAAAIASTFSKNVVNLLQAPAPAEPRQIMLEVKFASIDRTGLSELGFNYFSTNDKTLGSLTTQQFQTPRFAQFQFREGDQANQTLNFADLLNLFVFRPDLNIGATVRALQQRNLLQILAEPNLITLEGRAASFIAGGEFPYPTLTSTSTGGAVAPVITVQFKRFGVQLDFTPTVTSTGAIHLKVSPEVSSLDYSNAVTLQGILIPAIASRKADTEVLLRDGESFAIAGLIDNRVIQVLSSIPLLGDVPIVGTLFRSRSTRKATDELLVVVTPHFVKPLSPEERAKLPEMQEAFLPTLAEQKAAAEAKKKKKQKKAEFVGPRGHQEPK